MTNYSENTKRLTRNTIYLYLRSLFSMAIGIYTSRIVLSTLGVDDFGIYSFVGGVVAMFQMVSSTFIAATQRSISFEIGRKNLDRTRQIFSAALNIHAFVSIILLVLMETIGVWFINFKANIPLDRMSAANWVFQFSMATFVIDFISIPYFAMLISKEKMITFAMIGICESILKLAIVYFLFITSFDKLIFYSILMFLVTFTKLVFYNIYCKKYIPEAKHIKVVDKSINIELLHLSGWTFFGSSASILTLQGINILINLFFKVSVNAAKGVASQIQNVVTLLVNNFMMSLRPQITKSYSSNEKDYLYKLIDQGSRMAFFLMAIMTVPIIILSDDLLRIWLKEVPSYSGDFLRLIMVYNMFLPLNNILDTLLLATGDIKKWQLFSGMIDVINLPICYVLYKFGFPPYTIYFAMIPICFIGLLNRIYFCHKKTDLNYLSYFRDTMLRSIFSWTIPLITLYYIKSFFPPGLGWVMAMGVICILFTTLSIALFGLKKIELNMIKSKILSYIPV